MFHRKKRILDDRTITIKMSEHKFFQMVIAQKTLESLDVEDMLKPKSQAEHEIVRDINSDVAFERSTRIGERETLAKIPEYSNQDPSRMVPVSMAKIKSGDEIFIRWKNYRIGKIIFTD